MFFFGLTFSFMFEDSEVSNVDAFQNERKKLEERNQKWLVRYEKERKKNFELRQAIVNQYT